MIVCDGARVDDLLRLDPRDDARLDVLLLWLEDDGLASVPCRVTAFGLGIERSSYRCDRGCTDGATAES
jgi:hypothetical protein